MQGSWQRAVAQNYQPPNYEAAQGKVRDSGFRHMRSGEQGSDLKQKLRCIALVQVQDQAEDFSSIAAGA